MTTEEDCILMDLHKKLAADIHRAISDFNDMGQIAGIRGTTRLAGICQLLCEALVLFASACDLQEEDILKHVRKDYRTLNRKTRRLDA